ncbi:MAG: undecaprenyl/decaprenyl-phosphate alpha-N-acetylglucosaminyl 1-phosphate transferase [Muribaculaceae bacterium]|nr:undecaprenyl/decaprenyl-phosphate alpha-N-acetylglucosaminyl 1-phosphate transferase [Bacteroides sp.]MDE7472348.1 undecaprenyl/decaprenyl-phosphate alpha-N-acetylglucosaminyl 1-phosphate transferase [Muribaculaceae bacterium]
MDIWLIDILMTFGISVLLTGILIPQILLIAFRKQLFDIPDGRKIHSGVVPRLGGLAFMPAVMFSMACVFGVEMLSIGDTIGLFNISHVVQVCFITCALVLMYLVGMADDLVGVRYVAKFVVQIVSAFFIVGAGLSLKSLNGFMWIEALHPVIGVSLTVLVIVFVINAINLIDGIDGLASGLSAIALLFYGIAFYSSGEIFFSMLSAATIGTLVPFFYYNVFGDPHKRKKIFMGDTGALTIGVILSTLALKMSGMSTTTMDELRVNPLVVAFSPLIVPCFDVVRVYLHRLLRHRNPFLPDKCHIHHKILALGVPQRVAMIIILIISAMFITVNVLLSAFINVTWLVILDLVVWTLGQMMLTQAIHRRETQLGSETKLYE